MARTHLILEPAPIASLTLRQFAGGKAVRVVLFFSLVPAIFAAIYALDPFGTSPPEFVDGIFQGLVAPTILPIATLILATNALGDELEDRTMVYLVVKPLSRLRIVLEKFVAIVVTAAALLWFGMFVMWLIAVRGEATEHLDQLLAIEAAVLAGVLGYGALFMVVSLIVPRALLVGILYSLLWESLFGRYLPGVRLISVRHYVLSIYSRILDDPFFALDDAMRLPSAIIVIVVLVVVALLLAAWRLRAMNFE